MRGTNAVTRQVDSLTNAMLDHEDVSWVAEIEPKQMQLFAPAWCLSFGTKFKGGLHEHNGTYRISWWFDRRRSDLRGSSE